MRNLTKDPNLQDFSDYLHSRKSYDHISVCCRVKHIDQNISPVKYRNGTNDIPLDAEFHAESKSEGIFEIGHFYEKLSHDNDFTR